MSERDSAFDVFVIGGGINGCGMARDAAGRGFSVCLAETGDLAGGTSSAATKLIHGGLRYLEHYEFRLVRAALREREVLWAMAPHIIRPVRFVLPHHEGLRPAWLLRLGLFVYDHLGGRRLLPPARTLDLSRDAAGRPLKSGFRTAFEFSDCRVDDARLVVLNAVDAAERGAVIRPRCEVIGATRTGGRWRVRLRRREDGAEDTVEARVLVNAAGPWADRVLGRIGGAGAGRNIRLVRGSHIVVRRLFDHDRCYIFQNADGRVLFAIPFETDWTLIGTTDAEQEGDPSEARITAAETDYLCAAASVYFARPVTPDDIVWTYSGVRALNDGGATTAQEASRDYALRVDGNADTGALINVFGGKLTTYRRLAEEAVDRIGHLLGRRRGRWTAGAPLPGGDFGAKAFNAEAARFAADHPFLDAAHARGLFARHGTRARAVLAGARDTAGLGRHFGGGLYEAEVRHLVEREWAMDAQDIAWRRTKAGLRLAPADMAALETFVAGHRRARAASRGTAS